MLTNKGSVYDLAAFYTMLFVGRKINKDELANIINKFSNISFSKDDEVFKTLIDYDIKASNIYNLIYYKNNKNLLKGPMDFYISPKYVK